MVFCQYQSNYHNYLKIWRFNTECADLGGACDVWCHTPHTVVNMRIVGVCFLKQLTLTLKCLSVSIVTHRMDHNSTYEYQVL